MARKSWRNRLLESTRGRVLLLLRRTARTVSELAAQLALTDNAVRLHIAALERDGLVEPGGTRRERTGKPAVLYRTTSGAETLFPKAYAAMLGAVLEELDATHGGADTERLLRRAGTRLGLGSALPRAGAGRDLGAAPASSQETDTAARVLHAAQVLTALGGLVEVEEEGDGWLLQGYSCPLDALLPDHPRACLLAESLVSALVGVQATECCERSERPRCAFRVPAA